MSFIKKYTIKYLNSSIGISLLLLLSKFIWFSKDLVVVGRLGVSQLTDSIIYLFLLPDIISLLFGSDTIKVFISTNHGWGLKNLKYFTIHIGSLLFVFVIIELVTGILLFDKIEDNFIRYIILLGLSINILTRILSDVVLIGIVVNNHRYYYALVSIVNSILALLISIFLISPIYLVCFYFISPLFTLIILLYVYKNYELKFGTTHTPNIMFYKLWIIALLGQTTVLYEKNLLYGFSTGILSSFQVSVTIIKSIFIIVITSVFYVHIKKLEEYENKIQYLRFYLFLVFFLSISIILLIPTIKLLFPSILVLEKIIGNSELVILLLIELLLSTFTSLSFMFVIIRDRKDVLFVSQLLGSIVTITLLFLFGRRGISYIPLAYISGSIISLLVIGFNKYFVFSKRDLFVCVATLLLAIAFIYYSSISIVGFFIVSTFLVILVFNNRNVLKV